MRPLSSTCWLLLLFTLLALPVAAQPPLVLVSEGGTQNLCNASFYDSGYDGNYGPGEYEVITFCPGIPGAVIQVAFISFDLGPGDQLIIHDGPNTAAPVLVIGTGTSLAGLADSASTDCLTFEFISDGVGEGPGWQAVILCNQPCDEPVGTISPLASEPLKICPDATVVFDGSTSAPAPGHSIATYAWDFGDGTTSAMATPDHVFADPGQYNITLQVTDDIGCYSVNYAYVTVRVGTIPDLSATAVQPNPICVGESATLTGAVVGTTWTNVPEPFVEGLVVLPDGNGVSYNAAVEVSGFPGNTVISNANDLISLCLTMEHSYIGDLTFVLTCPTGQSVTIFDEYNLGTGPPNTFVGDANDSGNGVPGIGLSYCFGDQGNFGPFSVENAGGNWIPSTVTPGNNSMTPGFYQAEQSFANFIGCPLNGFWSITVTDNIGIDDGFIFDWGLTIEPSLYPDLIVFTPVYGAGCDSTFWIGPDIVTTGPDCEVITVAPQTNGSYDYVYSVTDDFGCTYDTTLTVIVTPAAIVEATASLPNNCGEPVQMNATLQAPIPGGPVVYQWTPAAGLNNTTIPSPLATPMVPTWYTITVFPAGHPMCGSVDSAFVNPLTNLQNDSIVVDAICNDDGTGSIQVITTGNGGPWTYVWTDANGNVVQTTLDANGDTFFGPGGSYEVVISEGANGNGCEDSLMAFINEPTAVEMMFLSDDTLICRTGTATLHALAQGGTGALTYHWNTGALSTPLTVSPTTLTGYFVWASDANNCVSDTLDVAVDVNSLLSYNLTTPVSSCPNVHVLLAPQNVAGGDGNYQFDWGAGFTPDSGLTVLAENSQMYCMTLSDGCETPDITHCVWLDVLPIPELIVTADSVLGCDPFFTRFHMVDTSGAALVQWDFGDGILIPGPTENVGHTFADPGTFDIRVVVQWPNGCFDTTTVADMITAEPVPNAEFTWTPLPVSVLSPETQFIEQAGPYAVSWIWDFAGVDTLHGPDPVYIFPNDVGNTYPVQLVVANYLGCTDTVMHFVEVEDEFLVFLPNAITPNGDGLNDQLFVLGDDIDTEEFALMIFDRWGEKLFETSDRADGWDGSYNGALVQDGVYAWRLMARSAYTKTPYELTGHVTVVH